MIKHDIIVMVAPHTCCLYMDQGGREGRREGGGEREGEGGRERARVKS